MKKEFLFNIASQRILIILLFLTAVTLVSAQSPDVESLLKAGKAADQSGNFKEAIASFQKAIELDPYNYKAHYALFDTTLRMYVRSLPTDKAPTEQQLKELGDKMKVYMDETAAKYAQLTEKNPKVTTYQLMAFTVNPYDPVKRLTFLEAAAKLEPNNLDVLAAQASFETSRGDNQKASEYYKKISDQKPGDNDALFSYVRSLKDVNNKLYTQKTLEFVKENPTDRSAFQGLQFLIWDTENINEQIGYYNQMRELFPPDKSERTIGAMTGLFAIYNETDPAKAQALAEEMVNLSKTDAQKKSWQSYLDYQTGINQATELVNQKKGNEAIALLEKIKAPRGITNPSAYNLVKARAQDATGDTATAYTELTKFYVSNPRKVVRQELDTLGKKLSKDKKQVEKDIQALVVAQAQPINDFSLVRFDNGKKVSLADYKGKVVLLNFWYPMCGPCHQEAPYLQKLTEKYGKDGFVILSVNAHPKEDTMVLPYFKMTKYNFIPLQVPDEEFAAREYQAKSFPTNYLIDKQGRKIFNIGVVYMEIWEQVQQKVEMALAQ